MLRSTRTTLERWLNRNTAVDDGSAWKLQYTQQRENSIYSYINLQQTGKLVDIYCREGVEGLESMIREELAPYLYNEGMECDVITKPEFIRWRDHITAKSLGVTSVDTRTDAEILADSETSNTPREAREFKEHAACWALNKRGSMGETLLHLAMLFGDREIFRDIAKALLFVFPHLAMDIYEGDEYYGESGLHLAAVHDNMDLLKILVANGADVNQKATGRFFLPKDQKHQIVKTNTNYLGSAYYGEYPLAFAACFEREQMYDYLIENGADPNLQDSFGNTVLHMLVISDKTAMFSYAAKHHIKRADMDIENYQKLTPLTLASKLGRKFVFNEIIELQRHDVWRYSDIKCSVYPLAALDTIGIHGETNWSAALQYITDGDSDEHLDMLEGGIIKQLLDDKWKYFARRRFLERFALALFHLLLMSIAIYLRPATLPPSGGGTPPPTPPLDAQTIVRYVCEVLVCLSCLITLAFQFLDMKFHGFLGFLKHQAAVPSRCVFNVACFLILLCVPLRFTNCQVAERVLLAFAAPSSWAFLLFFARGFNLTGVFVVMFYEMLKGDLARFGIIYLIFLPGFTLSYFFLFKDATNAAVYFDTIAHSIMTVFQMSLGEYKYADFSTTSMPAVTISVFVVFAILVPILLLNMLIAMFVTTYERVVSRSEKESKRQWAKIIIVMERTFSLSRLRELQESYSVPLSVAAPSVKPMYQGEGGSVGGSEGGEHWPPRRGLMVIKTTARSKALDKLLAVDNWKRLTALVVQSLKKSKNKYKISASSRFSISSPRSVLATLALQEAARNQTHTLSAYPIVVQQTIPIQRPSQLPGSTSISNNDNHFRFPSCIVRENTNGEDPVRKTHQFVCYADIERQKMSPSNRVVCPCECVCSEFQHFETLPLHPIGGIGSRNFQNSNDNRSSCYCNNHNVSRPKHCNGTRNSMDIDDEKYNQQRYNPSDCNINGNYNSGWEDKHDVNNSSKLSSIFGNNNGNAICGKSNLKHLSRPGSGGSVTGHIRRRSNKVTDENNDNQEEREEDDDAGKEERRKRDRELKQCEHEEVEECQIKNEKEQEQEKGRQGRSEKERDQKQEQRQRQGREQEQKRAQERHRRNEKEQLQEQGPGREQEPKQQQSRKHVHQLQQTTEHKTNKSNNDVISNRVAVGKELSSGDSFPETSFTSSGLSKHALGAGDGWALRRRDVDLPGDQTSRGPTPSRPPSYSKLFNDSGSPSSSDSRLSNKYQAESKLPALKTASSRRPLRLAGDRDSRIHSAKTTKAPAAIGQSCNSATGESKIHSAKTRKVSLTAENGTPSTTVLDAASKLNDNRRSESDVKLPRLTSALARGNRSTSNRPLSVTNPNNMMSLPNQKLPMTSDGSLLL